VGREVVPGCKRTNIGEARRPHYEFLADLVLNNPDSSFRILPSIEFGVNGHLKGMVPALYGAGYIPIASLFLVLDLYIEVALFYIQMDSEI
jgi:hypothetical protein